MVDKEYFTYHCFQLRTTCFAFAVGLGQTIMFMKKNCSFDASS